MKQSIDLGKMKKIVIIYLPNGNERIFTTSEEVSKGDSNYQLVKSIECDPSLVNVAYVDDDGVTTGESFYSMPYHLEMWQPKD